MLKLALPIALQQLLVSCAQLVDTAMVRGMGNVVVSSIGGSSRWIFLMNLFYFGISSGTAAMIAQFWGAREKNSIRKSYGIALIFGAAVAAVFMLAMFFIPKQLIRIFTSEQAVIDTAAQYMRIVAFMAPFAAFNQISCVALRSTERVNPPLYTSIISVALNTCLNYILINGKLGLPAMGIRGAAIATLSSTAAQAILLFIVLRTSKDIYNSKYREFFTFGKDFFRRFPLFVFPLYSTRLPGQWAQIYTQWFLQGRAAKPMQATRFSAQLNRLPLFSLWVSATPAQL